MEGADFGAALGGGADRDGGALPKESSKSLANLRLKSNLESQQLLCGVNLVAGGSHIGDVCSLGYNFHRGIL